MSRMVLMGGVALAASFVMGATAIGAAQQPKPIPNFMFTGSGWLGQGGTNFIQPKSGPGPIKNDPKFPYVGNNDTPGNQSTERVGDANDPILQPWAAEVVRQHNDLVHKGRRSFVAQARCWPGGGPAQLLFPAEPIFFIQRPQEVHIIWQRDHHVRRVRMNVPHSANAETLVVRRLRRPLRRRHARGRHDRFRHASISLRRQFPHAAQRAAPRGRALAHDRRRKASRSRSDGRGSESLHHAVEGDAGSGRRWIAVRCWNRCAPRTTSTRSTSTNTRCRKPRRRTSKPIGAPPGPSMRQSSQALKPDF